MRVKLYAIACSSQGMASIYYQLLPVFYLHRIFTLIETETCAFNMRVMNIRKAKLYRRNDGYKGRLAKRRFQTVRRSTIYIIERERSIYLQTCNVNVCKQSSTTNQDNDLSSTNTTCPHTYRYHSHTIENSSFKFN